MTEVSPPARLLFEFDDPAGQGMTGLSHADVTERLFMEFGATRGLPEVSELLRRCRVQLAAELAPSSPQFLERMARVMLDAPVVPTHRQPTP
jgi:hypothetical protein